MRPSVLAFVTLLLVPSVAAADDLDLEGTPPPTARPVPFTASATSATPAPVAPAPAPAPAAVAPPITADLGATAGAARTGIERRGDGDAAVHRAYLSPTALVAPAGSATVDVRAPLLPGALGTASVSLTDNIEIGAIGIYILDVDPGLGAHLKVQLFRTDTAAVAAALDVMTFNVDNDAMLFVGSLAASFCADGDDCRTLITAHLDGLGIAADISSDGNTAVAPGISLIHGARHKLITEVHAFREGDDAIVAGFVGARLVSGGGLAADVGLGFAGGMDESGLEVIPWPFFGLTQRM